MVMLRTANPPTPVRFRPQPRPGGEIGRRKGLKIPRGVTLVPVRLRPRAFFFGVHVSLFFLSLKLLRSGSGQAFTRLTVWLAIIGIFLGVMTLNAVTSVMNGFQAEVQKKLFGIAEHVVVRYYTPANQNEDFDFLNQQNHVKGVSPFLMTAGVLKHQKQAVPAMLLGIDPNQVQYDQLLHDPSVIQRLKPGQFQMIPGYELSRSLYLNSGDRPFLLTASNGSQLLMDVNLKRLNFNQAASFKVGKNLEEKLAFLHIEDLRAILDLGQKVSGFNLRLDDLYEAPALKSVILSHFSGRAIVSDWTEQYAELFSALRLQKTALSVILALIVIIALFNLTTGQVMLVNDKRSAIAIMLTCGISKWQLTRLFMYQALMIASVGIIFGSISGYWVAENIGTWVKYFEESFGLTLISNKVYLIDYLPCEFDFMDAVLIGGFTFVLAMIACLYPAYLARETSPASVLRYE
jgi:lipoprotein-releasing system permease protein